MSDEYDFSEAPKPTGLPKVHELDQSLTLVEQSFPGHWFRMYLELMKAGFQEHQAMRLLENYVRK